MYFCGGDDKIQQTKELYQKRVKFFLYFWGILNVRLSKR